MTENFNQAFISVRSAKYLIDRGGSEAVNPELAYALQNVLDETYRLIAEIKTEYEALQKAQPDPEWIVQKPVPVGSEDAKKTCEKVRQQEEELKKNAKFNGSIVAKKKGRPRKNDD